jgi:hypothetical protein
LDTPPVKGECKACKSFEPYTINRLLALGYGSRFVAERMPGLTRRDVRRHKETCLPGVLDEVSENLRHLAGAKRGRG